MSARIFVFPNRSSASLAALTLLALPASGALAQQTASSGRNLTPELQEVIVTGRSIEDTLPLDGGAAGEEGLFTRAIQKVYPQGLFRRAIHKVEGVSEALIGVAT